MIREISMWSQHCTEASVVCVHILPGTWGFLGYQSHKIHCITNSPECYLVLQLTEAKLVSSSQVLENIQLDIGGEVIQIAWFLDAHGYPLIKLV